MAGAGRRTYMRSLHTAIKRNEPYLPNLKEQGLKKRNCTRFSITGLTLFYREKPRFWEKGEFTRDYFPVLDISRGGLRFLSNHKISVGSPLTLRVYFPGIDRPTEIKAVMRWISKNHEKSYKYQNGVSFNPYGKGKDENSVEVLDLLKTLEPA